MSDLVDSLEAKIRFLEAACTGMREENDRLKLKLDEARAKTNRLENKRLQETGQFHALLAEASVELQWWIGEHGCCDGHQGDLIERINEALK